MGMGMSKKMPALTQISMRTLILIPIPTGTLMSINSSLKHGQSRGTEMCTLCTPARNAAVAVPNFSADFCNPCKRLKHFMQHKKYFLSRVKFYCYYLPPYGGSSEHEAKTASCSRGFFFFLILERNTFVQSWECPPQFLEWWCFLFTTFRTTKLQLYRLVGFSGVASADSEGIAPNSVHRWPSAQLEWEPAFARTSTVERPASFLLENTQNLYE